MKTKDFTELVENIGFAMLTSRNFQGGLSSRPLAVQQMDSEGNLWFLVNDSSSLAEEIRASNKVNVTLTKPESSIYVSLSGSAELSHDRGKLLELWGPSAYAYFPRGLDDPDLVILRVRIESAELWDSPSTKVVQAWKFNSNLHDRSSEHIPDLDRRHKGHDRKHEMNTEFEAVQT